MHQLQLQPWLNPHVAALWTDISWKKDPRRRRSQTNSAWRHQLLNCFGQNSTFRPHSWPRWPIFIILHHEVFQVDPKYQAAALTSGCLSLLGFKWNALALPRMTLLRALTLPSVMLSARRGEVKWTPVITCTCRTQKWTFEAQKLQSTSHSRTTCGSLLPWCSISMMVDGRKSLKSL